MLTGLPEVSLIAIAFIIGVKLIPTLVDPSREFYMVVDRCSRPADTEFRPAVEGTRLKLVFRRRRIKLFLRLAATNSRPPVGVHDRNVDAVVVILVAFEP